MANQVLEAIMKRRSIVRFKSDSIDQEKIQSILEAGRWAPSWLNMQPWRFIIIEDRKMKEQISSIVPSVFNLSIKDAPVCVVTCVDPKTDPFHFIEDGTAATQNMALAAHSLGLGTSWIGIFSLENERKSSERKLKDLLNVQKDWRVISILPIGVPKFKETKTRKELAQLTNYETFTEQGESKILQQKIEKPKQRIEEVLDHLDPISTPPV